MPHPPHRAVWFNVPPHLSAIHVSCSARVTHIYFVFETDFLGVDERTAAVLVRSLEDDFADRVVIAHCLKQPANHQITFPAGYQVVFARKAEPARSKCD